MKRNTIITYTLMLVACCTIGAEAKLYQQWPRSFRQYFQHPFPAIPHLSHDPLVPFLNQRYQLANPFYFFHGHQLLPWHQLSSYHHGTPYKRFLVDLTPPSVISHQVECAKDYPRCNAQKQIKETFAGETSMTHDSQIKHTHNHVLVQNGERKQKPQENNHRNVRCHQSSNPSNTQNGDQTQMPHDRRHQEGKAAPTPPKSSHNVAGTHRSSNQRQFENDRAKANNYKQENIRTRAAEKTPTRPYVCENNMRHQPVREPSDHRSTNLQHKKEIASIEVKGYDPEDIAITTKANQLYVSGKHACSCEESCFEREFQRRIQIPQQISTKTINAKFHKDEVLRITGIPERKQPADYVDTKIVVEADKAARTSHKSTDPTCGGMKGGIKLSKMNKRTGEVLEEVPITIKERTYEEEVDNDGVTIEVDDD